ncbi:hypothetical protein B1B12_07900 [Cutibacterium acnes subsp. defendens]|nr:hypothetical protein B1B02_09380 [Cutibacterium acnes subsp. defendens]PIS94318.1 hypothetical protein CER06_00805 [Cutibacterium acnes]PGF26472.1 hypothetical protein B1B08_09360 [Cutibacterium acnes subsp. defendens]PGF45595.1 hypothetical protein B1B12_07900 [Cutibacterium acnes subsp. defendens]PGF58060.1 hypothetical protein B1C79_10505 [Cutibacterium acnes subsp. defendens]
MAAVAGVAAAAGPDLKRSLGEAHCNPVRSNFYSVSPTNQQGKSGPADPNNGPAIEWCSIVIRLPTPRSRQCHRKTPQPQPGGVCA